MTTIYKRIGYLILGFGVVFVAMFCSLINYIIGTVRITLIEGKRVKINFNEFFNRPTLDQVIDKYGFDHMDIEAYRAAHKVM